MPHAGLSCSASEPCNFLDAIRPVAQAFADHDAEQLLIDLLAVFHRHWPSRLSSDHQFADPSAPRFSSGSNIASYEPLLGELMLESDLLQATRELTELLPRVSLLPSGRRGSTVLAELAAYLFDPAQSPSLRYRDGRSASVASDGATAIPGGVSPFYLIADALAAIERELQAAQNAGGTRALAASAWRRGNDAVIEHFVGVDGFGAESRFVNTRFVVIAERLLDFVSERVAEHRRQGDLLAWVDGLAGDVAGLLDSPATAGAVDLLGVLLADDEAARQLKAFVGYLADERQSIVFDTTVTAFADLLQLAQDEVDLLPVGRAVARGIDPASGLLAAGMSFLSRAISLDTDDVLLPLLERSYNDRRADDDSGVAMQQLLDLVASVHRTLPGSNAPYSSADIGAILSAVGDFLASERGGLRGFFEIVSQRCGGEPCDGAGL